MDELQISGKRFISSRRIARDNGYTSDYIGQLIRGGKVIGQKVGRAWYVDAISFEAFLGGEGASVKLPEEKVLGSAPPQPDHFPQKVLPPQVAPSAAQTFFSEPPAPVEKEETHHIPLHLVKSEVSSGLRYYGDESSSLPQIREIQIEKNETPLAYQDDEVRSMSDDVFAPHAPRRVRPLRVAGLAALGVAVLIFTAALSSVISLNLSVGEGNTASASYSLHW